MKRILNVTKSWALLLLTVMFAMWSCEQGPEESVDTTTKDIQIADDELVEVTPNHIRMRKTILSKEQRMKAQHRKK